MNGHEMRIDYSGSCDSKELANSLRHVKNSQHNWKYGFFDNISKFDEMGNTTFCLTYYSTRSAEYNHIISYNKKSSNIISKIVGGLPAETDMKEYTVELKRYILNLNSIARSLHGKDVILLIFENLLVEKSKEKHTGREKQYFLRCQDPIYIAKMGIDFLGWEKEMRTRDSRNKLRRKNKQLELNVGKAEIIEARAPDEIDRVLAAFLDQRARMAAVGRIPNPFSDPRRQAFLREAAIGSLGGREGFRLHALQAGGRIVATHGALFSGDYMSGYMTSMDEDFARYSPGKILQREVLRLAHEEGVREFDLGLGDDAYKAEWAERVDLYDVLVPLTWKGHVAALFIAARLRVLFLLKRTTSGRALLRRARLALDRMRALRTPSRACNPTP